MVISQSTNIRLERVEWCKHMIKEIREQLVVMREEGYRKFSAALVPGVNDMLGIRLPKLRTLARQIASGDWETALSEPDIYFEERMLRGMVISCAIKDLRQAIPYIEEYIPLVDNWSICDSVFSSMDVLEQDTEYTWNWLQPYLNSGKEFEVRVALLVMMQHLLKTDNGGNKMKRLKTVTPLDLSNNNDIEGIYIDRILTAVNRPFPEGYYAMMAAAWLIAEAFCTFPYHTMQLLNNNNIDNTTYNKAIQKIIESRIPTAEVKKTLKGMRKR